MTCPAVNVCSSHTKQRHTTKLVLKQGLPGSMRVVGRAVTQPLQWVGEPQLGLISQADSEMTTLLQAVWDSGFPPRAGGPCP